jgi:hypothetical protein
MTSGLTREFLALCAIAQRFGRPGTDRPRLSREPQQTPQDPSIRICLRSPNPRRCALSSPSPGLHCNPVRLHQGVGYVPPDDEHEGRGAARRKALEAGPEQARLRRLARHRAEREVADAARDHGVGRQV